MPPSSTARHPLLPKKMPTCRSKEKSPSVQQRGSCIARRQPTRKSKMENSVIFSGAVREALDDNPKVILDQNKESEHITISFETSVLTSISDFELPQELRDRASLTNGRFAFDRTGSVQIPRTTVPAIWHRLNIPRNVSYEKIDVKDHSSSRADVLHVSVNRLLGEVPATQRSEAEGLKSTISDIGDAGCTQHAYLQKAQNLISKIQDYLHDLGQLLGATQSILPPLPYDPYSVGDILLNDYREMIGQWLNGIIDTTELNSNLKELFKRFPTAELIHGHIVVSLQESQNMVEMEHDGLGAEKWMLRDIRASNTEFGLIPSWGYYVSKWWWRWWIHSILGSGAHPSLHDAGSWGTFRLYMVLHMSLCVHGIANRSS